MSDEDDSDNMWHTGLHARLDTSFPKKCTNCGRIFETAEQYFTETLDINNQDRGLKSFVDDDTATVVEAFRNCPCGSTLMEMFDDHRDSIQDEVVGDKRVQESANPVMVEDPPADRAPTVSATNSTTVDNLGLPRMRTAGRRAKSSYEDIAASIESGLSELDLLHVEEKWGDEWYSGLRPRGESAFPKTCANCGRVYKTSEDYFTATANIKPDYSGLKACDDEGDGVIIEAFRNCLCGSTLMDNFSDRRDMSSTGRQRRDRFDQMLNYLVEIGLNADIAQSELLKVARGGESKILAKIKPPEKN